MAESQSGKCLSPRQEKVQCLSRKFKNSETSPEIGKLHLMASDQRPLEVTWSSFGSEGGAPRTGQMIFVLAFGSFYVTFITASS